MEGMQTLKKRLMVELILLGILLVALVLFARHFETKQIYYPEKNLVMTPSQLRLPYEEVTLVTKDRVKISGWFIPADKPLATMIFCHGNAGNNGDRVAGLMYFHKLGLNILIFDYRGFGKSEGKPSEKGTYLDALAAADYLKTRKDVDPEKIICYGESLGGAVAIDLATRIKPAGLIVVDTFTSVYAASKDIYPFLPIRWLIQIRYNSLSKIKKLHCPVLIGHSKEDDILPFHHGQELFKAANPPKEFMTLKGSHEDALFVSDKKPLEQIRVFIRKAVEKK